MGVPMDQTQHAKILHQLSNVEQPKYKKHHEIINNAVSNVSEYTASQQQSVRHTRHAIRHHKKNAGYPLSIPPSLETMIIPQQYQVTHSNEPFLLFDSGIDRYNRIPIYSTDTNLRALSTIGQWFVDVHLKLSLNLFLL